MSKIVLMRGWLYYMYILIMHIIIIIVVVVQHKCEILIEVNTKREIRYANSSGTRMQRQKYIIINDGRHFICEN